ncbi:sensor histidine kinase [Aquabacterium humicola]|uniref:sensor histidine kinase n=1 Tax=Aquabacterium humicola TaxID=3237377 RepID=UPI00254387C3|nr:ATP-binding protein [Rubrivivax pictus]
MNPSRSRLARRAVPLIGALLMLALVALAATLAYAWGERREFARLDDAAAHQLDLYAAVLDIELGKQADLPWLIDADGEIESLLRTPEPNAIRGAVNRRLTRFATRSGALWAAVIDGRGRVVATSDWYRPDSQLDHIAASEPCVAEALAGQDARRFAVDPTSGAPEVCLARPLVRDGRTLGALLVRISLEPIEATWVDAAFRAESEKPLVVDQQGMVIMSSVPGWKYRPLGSLTVPSRMLPGGVQLVRLQAPGSPGTGLHVLHERPLARFGWRLLILSSAASVQRDARTAAWGAGTLVTCIALLLMLVVQRRRVVAQKLATRAALQRANDELEAKVRQRTAELEASNRELRHEIDERHHAEQVLRQAQEELVQSGKLALLGQLSAGISHELGQPLTALRALAANGRLLLDRGRGDQVRENLSSIASLVERMGRITSQLKAFTRKSPSSVRPVALADAVANACQLLATRLQDEDITLRIELPDALEVQCDGYRLEQVLVNLMGNAADALRGTAERRLTVQAEVTGGRARVRVIDSGPGISAALNERLFEPFFTTKPPGEGLGLGLVISSHIVREFGGQLRSVPAASGAVFEFDLALADAGTDAGPPALPTPSEERHV